MIVQICADTDIGLVRQNNEDAIAFDAAKGICVLADGMGGHAAGEIASGMAATLIESAMHDWLMLAEKHTKIADVENALARAISTANRTIYDTALANPDCAGMGTTLVAGVFHGSTLILAHVGDSRCYRFRSNQLHQITQDHSVRQEQINGGFMMYAQADMPHQHLLTKALGIDENVDTEIHHHKLKLNDLYLMCSDGLTEMVSAEEISVILSAPGSLMKKAKQLISSANAAGGRDNISVLLAQANDARKKGILSSARRAIIGAWSGLRKS